MSSLPKLLPRRPDAHKGDFGRALLIGGSRGMAGAIALAGMACLRSGAGLVKLAAPSWIQPTVAAFDPCYMTISLSCSGATGEIVVRRAQAELEAALKAATAIAIGPGLGQSDEARQLVAWIFQTVKQPLIVDADGLNALSELPDGLAVHAGPRVLTPHPGEFSRLIRATGTIESRDEQVALAKELAHRHRLVLVLKGHQTLITDGVQHVLNATGNPGMATGGTGDVLTGIITALICQGLSPHDAAVLGAHVHGLAGDLAAAELGQVSLIASDLLRYLPKAWRAVM